jgi:hypothetical protein
MKTRRGWVQGYNAQAVVTPDQIILAADVTTEANDVRQLTGMLNQAQANVAAVMGEDATLGAAVADAGYWSEANAESQTEECELFIATQKDRKQRAALSRCWPTRMGEMSRNRSPSPPCPAPRSSPAGERRRPRRGSLKRFPCDLNRWDSEEVKDGRVFVHLILLQGAGDAKGLFW